MSCSIAPDSRRSDWIGRLLGRSSHFRESWLRRITGTPSSFARSLKPRLIELMTLTRFSPPVHELQVVDHQHVESIAHLVAPCHGANSADRIQGRLVREVQAGHADSPRCGAQLGTVLLHAVPFLIMFSGIFPTEATARSMSCPLLISRLSASTDFRSLSAAWIEQDIAKVVLPIAGRPATTISCPGRNPPILASRSVSPEEIPIRVCPLR